MKISKIESIKNLAVFQDFNWDSCVLDKNNNAETFKDVNILYGRNYSGKTTLSRIVRAMETGRISDKYKNPEFDVLFEGNKTITQNTLLNHNEEIRVFNSDFVSDNLKFIENPNENIESFAILGEDNNKIECEIKLLEEKLGSDKLGKETGLYKEEINVEESFNLSLKTYNEKIENLDKQLNKKATDRKSGIKYKADIYGDQNYTKAKLKTDIKTVLKEDYFQIDEQKKSDLTKLIHEKTKDDIPPLERKELQFNTLIGEAKSLLNKEISDSGKIKELVENAILNKWVQEGLTHHESHSKCGFCDNPIKKERWEALENHFDEASKTLGKNIDELISKIQLEKDSLVFEFNKNLFYSKFEASLNNLNKEYKDQVEKQNNSLESLIGQLQERKLDLIHTKEFNETESFTSGIEAVFTEYKNIRLEVNTFTKELETKQYEAKKTLRLCEVYDFALIIEYAENVKDINKLEAEKNNTYQTLQEKKEVINLQISEINAKKAQLNDEENGAIKINSYLNDFLGHKFLSLKPIEQENEGEIKKIYFEVIRDGKKAHHLSEGECSLIAFCYFMAKLDDIDTQGTKPIIWIDDPISSLDGNHIFFIYSLIKSEIVKSKKFQQLFISTHNLEFLKYLKRISRDYKGKGNSKVKIREFFTIERQGSVSSICIMPNYLKKYVTEFNYLFDQIYKCSQISIIDDLNYSVFYNFGNNARKFLEIYLYYKYPDNSDHKMIKFFGDEIPSMLTERTNNEYSHLNGGFERGAVPIDQPEMLKIAKLIIQKLKEKDKEQYQALLNSIGKSEDNVVELQSIVGT